MLPEYQGFDFNVIIPQPFSLKRHTQENVDKIREEVMERVKSWENNMSTFFGEYREAADSWRMIPRKVSGKPTALFNSKSGETNRAVNTLASLWFRMLTASDPFFEARSWQGTPSEEDLYATEGVMSEQLTRLQYKRKLFKVLRSLALMGTVIIEEPWVSLPVGVGQKSFEGTDFMFRSLLQTAFDPYVYDLEFSDFIATIDYPSKFRLREYANLNSDTWDRDMIEDAIRDRTELNSNRGGFSTDVWNRINERKQRAGYQQLDNSVFELINYHGKLDSNNPVMEDWWQSEGRTDDIRFTDWTVGILDGQKIPRFHGTPFGTWHHNFKTAHINEFELEPIGYGVGKLGKRQQRELDTVQSRSNDALTMGIYTMWKVGRYAGLKSNQLQIKPFNVVELEDVNQLEQLKVDFQAIVQALAMQGILKEDFRAITGASSNLQAQVTNATASEAALAQTEAIRGNSVMAEIIAETLVREHLNTCHVNNVNLLDNEIWVELSGGAEPKFAPYSRNNLPASIGFRIRTTTDKDFRPERLQRLLEGINMATSIRQIVPASMNVVRPLLEEWFRSIGISPRRLREPIPVMDQVTAAIQRGATQGGGNGGGAIGNEVAGEVAEEGSGAVNIADLPIGDVPTSPLPSSAISSGYSGI